MEQLWAAVKDVMNILDY